MRRTKALDAAATRLRAAVDAANGDMRSKSLGTRAHAKRVGYLAGLEDALTIVASLGGVAKDAPAGDAS